DRGRAPLLRRPEHGRDRAAAGRLRAHRAAAVGEGAPAPLPGIARAVSPLFDRARWARIEPLLDELLGVPPDERRARLATIAGDDAELGRELESLLDDAASAAHAKF